MSQSLFSFKGSLWYVEGNSSGEKKNSLENKIDIQINELIDRMAYTQIFQRNI